MYVRMYEQNRARDHFSDIRFAAAYPRTLSLTFSRPDVNGSELFFNDLQRCCRVIITTLVFSPFSSISLPLSLFCSLSLSFFFYSVRACSWKSHADELREISNRVQKNSWLRERTRHLCNTRGFVSFKWPFLIQSSKSRYRIKELLALMSTWFRDVCDRRAKVGY